MNFFTKLDDFLPFVSFMVLVILRLQKIAFSADQLIFQKQKLDVSITKPFLYEFEASVFNQELVL